MSRSYCDKPTWTSRLKKKIPRERIVTATTFCLTLLSVFSYPSTQVPIEALTHESLSIHEFVDRRGGMWKVAARDLNDESHHRPRHSGRYDFTTQPGSRGSSERRKHPTYHETLGQTDHADDRTDRTARSMSGSHVRTRDDPNGIREGRGEQVTIIRRVLFRSIRERRPGTVRKHIRMLTGVRKQGRDRG